MAQTYAITGGMARRRPALARRAELEAQAPYIPSMMRAKDEKSYGEDVLNETKRQNQAVNAETARQNQIANQQWLQSYEANQDATDTANKFRMAELGLGGFTAINEATDGGVMNFGKKALDAVMPESFMPGAAETVAGSFDAGGAHKVANNAMNFDAKGAEDSLWSGIKDTASSLTPDFIEEPLKKLFSPSTWTGEDGIWSDVSGFVDDIMPDFDFDFDFF